MYIHDSVKFEVFSKQYELANAASLWISVSDNNQAPSYTSIVYLLIRVYSYSGDHL